MIDSRLTKYFLEINLTRPSILYGKNQPRPGTSTGRWAYSYPYKSQNSQKIAAKFILLYHYEYLCYAHFNYKKNFYQSCTVNSKTVLFATMFY